LRSQTPPKFPNAQVINWSRDKTESDEEYRRMSYRDLDLQSLHVYPVKSLRGYPEREVEVARWGFERDRRWMVVAPDGKFLSQREWPMMARIAARPGVAGLALSTDTAAGPWVAIPTGDAERRRVRVWADHLAALDGGAAARDWLSSELGMDCGLVYLDDTDARPVDPAYATPDDRTAFTDGFPVLVTNAASLVALNEALPAPITMDRFRPNIVLGGAPAWAEDCWRRIRIGAVIFRVVKPCARCAVTTVDQMTGARPDKTEPLRALSQLRRTADGVIFGQNLIPEASGRIALGDPVEILEAGSSNLRFNR
jgi:uncharacterized protein